MINTPIKEKHLIILIQAYATCIQSANGDLGAASKSLDMFKYIREKFSRREMMELHTFIENINKTHKVAMTMEMEKMGIKSEVEPLIKIVTH